MSESYELSTTDYPYKSWGEKFPSHKVDLKSLITNKSWIPILENQFSQEYFLRLESYLSHCIKVSDGQVKIYPYPDLLFNAINSISLDEIKVVVLGQDPYHNRTEIIEQDEEEDGKEEVIKSKSTVKYIPQAMGLSFSVPIGVEIPSSLQNIYKNMKKYGHMSVNPTHGNLMFWALQGCLLLNTSLTVQHGHPGSHMRFWEDFTDYLIHEISKRTKNIVFVLWGSPALKKLNLIDQEKHKVVISSHPSGLSCYNPLSVYSSFVDQNHFGIINKYLKAHNKMPIVWQLG